MPSLEARPEPSRLAGWLVAAGRDRRRRSSIGFVLFAAMGKNPWQALYAFFIEPVDTLYGVGELLLKATPLMLIAVGLAVGYRANVWNIGAEGQLIVGAICRRRRRARALRSVESRCVLPLMLVAGMLGRHGCGRRSPRSCARASTPTRSWSR